MRGIVSVILVALIILLSVGMLAPRLLRGRADAGRMHCLHNLGTLYKALFVYHEQHDAFPRAVAPTRGLPPEQRVSWYVALLPYFKQEQLARAVQAGVGWNGVANKNALDTPVALFQCPAELTARSTNVTHYLAMTGLDPQAARLPLDHPRAGCFGYFREVTLDYIREWDWTSNTILLLESARQNGPWLAGGRGTARGLDPTRPPYLGANGQFGDTHPVGAQALFADGSARMNATSITPRVLEGLCTLGGD